ncbi:GRIN [Lepeophtheirus salmonis]|uniref:GRIN n=1 Tax=Lepeophtheirus salmonis TaxID=72036 RepID=A0A7R8CH57_LEPSM|nr:GRIN [Lepeophtheirus salmonis]CAF2764556.1 GRIN [Lepeophtheirus salmonis]
MFLRSLLFLLLSSGDLLYLSTSSSFYKRAISIKIGAIFHENELAGHSYKGFQASVSLINRLNDLSNADSIIHLNYDSLTYTNTSSYYISKSLCDGFENKGFHVILGPSDPLLSAHVQSICDALDVPHIETINVNTPWNNKQVHSEFSLNVRPQLREVSQAFTDVILTNGWTRVGFIFGEESFNVSSSIGNAAWIISLQNTLLEQGVDTLTKGFYIGEDANEEILLSFKQKDYYHILLDLDSNETLSFFQLCDKVGLSNKDYHFLHLRLDFKVSPPSSLHFSRSFSYFQILDQENPNSVELATALGGPFTDLDLETAWIFDALSIVSLASAALDYDFSSSPSTSCYTKREWTPGPTFFNYLNTISHEGLTGKLKFSTICKKSGERSYLNLELMAYSSKSYSVRQLGSWNSDSGLSLFNGTEEPEDYTILDPEEDKETLIIVTKEERPYVMFQEGLIGINAYDGFAIDLIKAIAEVLGFKYRLYTVPDNLYGFYNHETGEWNGIVKQLIDKRADLAAPKPQPTELFSFMNPLALEIWLYILFAYVLVSITIWIIARFSPYEWAYPNPCQDRNRLVFQNDFTLPNSFWFAIGTLMQQGSDVNPKAASTRIVGGIWWFFTLIMISSYTANLAAFLTVERMATPIESAEDLAKQSNIGYGTLAGGSTMTFFRDSKVGNYQKMWRYMESKGENESFVTSYESGVEKVLSGNYAFLGESTMLDYLVQRNCNLTQIGDLIDSKGYGIATPKGSKWRDKISQAILFLQEKGVIQMYYNKWWRNKSQSTSSSTHCSTKPRVVDSVKANALGIVNIGGIFVVLLCGLAVAVIVAIMEFCWSNSSSEIPLVKYGKDFSNSHIPFFSNSKTKHEAPSQPNCSQCVL